MESLDFLNDAVTFWAIIDRNANLNPLRLLIEIMKNDGVSQAAAADRTLVEEEDMPQLCDQLEKLKLIRCKLPKSSTDRSKCRLYLQSRGLGVKSQLLHLAKRNGFGKVGA